jgi:two-component system cell cycle response regulator
VTAQRNYTLSISFGVSYYDPEEPCSVDELIAHADKMMYEQKRLRQKA